MNGLSHSQTTSGAGGGNNNSTFRANTRSAPPKAGNESQTKLRTHMGMMGGGCRSKRSKDCVFKLLAKARACSIIEDDRGQTRCLRSG